MSIIYPGALGEILRERYSNPSPGVVSFANKFIQDCEPILGTNATIERKFSFDPVEQSAIVYQLQSGKTFRIGVEKREGEYPVATIGI